LGNEETSYNLITNNQITIIKTTVILEVAMATEGSRRIFHRFFASLRMTNNCAQNDNYFLRITTTSSE